MNSESVLPNSLTKIRNEIDVAKPPIGGTLLFTSLFCGLVATKNSVQEAIDYVDSMNSFEAQLAFYILWNAISKDYILIPRENVTEEDK